MPPSGFGNVGSSQRDDQIVWLAPRLGRGAGAFGRSDEIQVDLVLGPVGLGRAFGIAEQLEREIRPRNEIMGLHDHALALLGALHAHPNLVRLGFGEVEGGAKELDLRQGLFRASAAMGNTYTRRCPLGPLRSSHSV